MQREDADIATSSEDYAGRFQGPVGQWFLDTQTGIVLRLLDPLPRGSSILDVGGGHAQITPPLIDAGYQVTVVASDPVCSARLEPWLSKDGCRFEVADLQKLPFEKAAFDAVVCLRLLPHSISWKGLIRELCRVARRSVVVDYPSARSVNIISAQLFSMKRRVELNTREFMTFRPADIEAAFSECGFAIRAQVPQFLIPMAFHRMIGRASLSRALELPGQAVGLTRWLGSPILARADRRTG